MSNDELAVTIGARVWKVASANGRNIWKAADAVAKKLTPAERDALVVWACVQAERLALQRNRPVEGGDHHPSATHGAGVEPLNRRRLFLEGQNPADYIVAIANTGERKRLGDLTKEDIQLTRRYVRVIAETYTDKDRGWGLIEKRVPDGGTLGDVLNALTTREREFLANEYGFKWEEAA